MKHLRFHSIVVAVVMLVCLLSIFPVEENLRLGKDLAGGVSLIYTIDVKPDDPSDVVDRTISVLKDRVNPQGLFEITFQQIGRDRVEITMPLPNEKVKRLRQAYDTALARLEAFSVDPDAFQRAMRLKGDERRAALQALMDTPGRRELLMPVLDAVEKARQAREAYEAAREAGLPGPELDALLERAGEAEDELDQARNRVLASVVTVDGFRAALELPDRSHKITDPRTREVVSLPSPRAQAIAGFRERLGRLPGANDAIDAVLAVHAEYTRNRKSLDDPSDLIRLLKGAGVLEFRIAVAPNERPDELRLRQELRERGPDNVQVDAAGWYRINAIENWFTSTDDLRALRDDPATYFASRYNLVAEQRDGLYYVLLHDAPGLRITKAEGDWSLIGAFVTSDQLGRPAVGFRMDPKGASLMGDLTQRHRERQMAVVLDDQVYTAPSIRSRISSDGIIEGNFSPQELDYLVKTLGAGSLQAKLGEKPISQSVLAPQLGADNLRKGLKAAWISFAVIGVFMCVYYFFSGAVAMVALVANALILLGVMALNKAAFTLPGIAGVILVFGTAVDANVLIYERIREELLAGNDVRAAVRVAFKRVGSTIVDANATNLLVCAVIAGLIPLFTPPQEIKGFGITLGIGVIANMFCALIVTRLIFVFLADRLKAGTWLVAQLPVSFPFIQRAMTPRVQWMRWFPVFAVISAVFVGLGLFFIFFEGQRLLGSEFRGGSSITLQLKEDDGSTPASPRHMKLTRAQVEERVRRVVADAEARGERGLTDLRHAEIVPIDPEADGVTSDRFIIRTIVTDETLLRRAIADALGDVVESRPAVRFENSDADSIQAAPVYPVIEPALGVNIGRPDVQNDVSEFIGGVAIVLREMDPPPTRTSLVSRLEYMRGDPTYSADALRREFGVVIIDGGDDAVRTAAVLARDPRISVFEDEARWRVQLAEQEWRIVRDALTVPTVLAGVNSFSPAIAASFRAQAIVAVLLAFILITIYVWVRFGSIRYSLAAVIPLIHDTIVAIGLVALAEIIYEYVPGAARLGVRPIKIDLGLVAAIMTIIGYSLNDTIVVLDRIRENRGKLAYATADVINNSINQTMSRTIVTGGTSLMALFVLFFVGGEAISSFAYTMICGMIVGTWSSVVIAAPIVYTRRIPPAAHITPDVERGEEAKYLPTSAGV